MRKILLAVALLFSSVAMAETGTVVFADESCRVVIVKSNTYLKNNNFLLMEPRSYSDTPKVDQVLFGNFGAYSAVYHHGTKTWHLDLREENETLDNAMRSYKRLCDPTYQEPESESKPEPIVYKEGQTASNEQGDKLIFRDGQWVPLETSYLSKGEREFLVLLAIAIFMSCILFLCLSPILVPWAKAIQRALGLSGKLGKCVSYLPAVMVLLLLSSFIMSILMGY
jgi:hypothetical protein